MSHERLQTTLRDLPARLVTPDGAVPARLVGLTGLVLHLRLPDAPPPLQGDVRVRLQDASPIMGSVQFLVRAVTVLRDGDQVDVMLRVQKIFVGADEVTAARLLRAFLPGQELSTSAFDQVPRGVIYTCGPPRRSTREMISAALGREASEERPEPEPAEETPRPTTSPGTAPGRVHQNLLLHTHDVRIPVLLHVQGRRIQAVAYRTSLDGRRFFVCAVGPPPTFGSRVDVTVDLPVTGRVDRALLVASVAWAAPCEGTFAVALRTSPQTNEEHIARWASSLLHAVRRQRERTGGVEAAEAEIGSPPEDAVALASAMERAQRPAASGSTRRVVTQPLGVGSGASFVRSR